MRYTYIKDLVTGKITGHKGMSDVRDLKNHVITTEEEYNQQHAKVYSKAVQMAGNGSN